MAEITQLRTALLSDIPAQLRQMAEDIEAGRIHATSAVLIIPRKGDWPAVYGWGEHMGDHANIAVCEMAKHWFVANKVGRL
jgi:hypothetical protein